MARPPAGRGRHAQHAARVVGQRFQAQVQDVAQARRQRARDGVRSGEQLLGEEGVALAARVQARDQAGLGGRPQDARHLLGQLGLREGPDLEALDDLAALLLGQERAQRMAAVQLVAAIGADEQQALVAQAAHQRRQELERRAVRPVEVLDREQDGRLGGQAVQQRAQQPEESRLGQRLAGAGDALAGSSGRWVALSSAAVARDRRRSGPRARRRPPARARGEAAQRSGDRRVGHAVGAEGQAVAAQDARAAGDRQALELAQQPRLAHAGLAADEHGGRGAALGARERRFQAAELRGAADERGARDAGWHRAIIFARHGRGGRFTRVPGGGPRWPPRRASGRRAWPGSARRARWRSSRR